MECLIEYLEELLDQLDGDDLDEQFDTESYGPLGSTGPLLETSWASIGDTYAFMNELWAGYGGGTMVNDPTLDWLNDELAEAKADSFGGFMQPYPPESGLTLSDVNAPVDPSGVTDEGNGVISTSHGRYKEWANGVYYPVDANGSYTT